METEENVQEDNPVKSYKDYESDVIPLLGTFHYALTQKDDDISIESEMKSNKNLPSIAEFIDEANIDDNNSKNGFFTTQTESVLL